MFVVVVNTPLKVIIGLPPVAFILVKDANTLQVASRFNIKVAVNVPSSDVNTRMPPVLELNALNAVVIVYIIPFFRVTVVAPVDGFDIVPAVQPDVPANVTLVVLGNVNVPVIVSSELIV
mgnify:CR=1 FL=1